MIDAVTSLANTIVLGFITFFMICAAAWIGIKVRDRLPDNSRLATVFSVALGMVVFVGMIYAFTPSFTAIQSLECRKSDDYRLCMSGD